jgi:hypothetical protein
MKSKACAKFFSASVLQRIWMRATLVICGFAINRWILTVDFWTAQRGNAYKSGLRFAERNDYNNSLFHRVGRYDPNTLDHDPLRRLAHFTRVGFRHWRITNLCEDILALDQFAERGVLAIEPRNRRKTDKKLRTSRIGISASRHRYHAAIMGMMVEFRFDFVTRAPLPIALLFGRILRIRVSTLNHESFHDSVENGPIIKAIPGQLLKVLDCIRRGIGPELHDHFAFARFYHGNFI